MSLEHSHTHEFVYCFPVVFMLQWQNWVIVAHPLWSIILKLFSIWHFKEKVCSSLLQLWGENYIIKQRVKVVDLSTRTRPCMTQVCIELVFCWILKILWPKVSFSMWRHWSQEQWTGVQPMGYCTVRRRSLCISQQKDTCFVSVKSKYSHKFRECNCKIT